MEQPHAPSLLKPSVSLMGPGAMQAVRMPSGPHSMAMCFIMASIAAFALPAWHCIGIAL